jgi:hypothetical protein
MTQPRPDHNHNNSKRRKLEFQTGVTDRTRGTPPAYTPHRIEGCPR